MNKNGYPCPSSSLFKHFEFELDVLSTSFTDRIHVTLHQNVCACCCRAHFSHINGRGSLLGVGSLTCYGEPTFKME